MKLIFNLIVIFSCSIAFSQTDLEVENKTKYGSCLDANEFTSDQLDELAQHVSKAHNIFDFALNPDFIERGLSNEYICKKAQTNTLTMCSVSPIENTMSDYFAKSISFFPYSIDYFYADRKIHENYVFPIEAKIQLKDKRLMLMEIKTEFVSDQIGSIISIASCEIRNIEEDDNYFEILD